ncbi:peptide chain release factor 2 [Rhodovibrio sodomensis]|uniref:peptide chain release factor 2 n=1 Tax=Rhodovibrio sodomensis TaxID=1088 RepID=UPI001904FD52|nr:peptide chain release factor 2 [Rhodovibrio sodomensis]
MRAETESLAGEIRESLALLRRHLDWDNARRRLDELNAYAEDPNIWNDPDRAQELMKERQHLDTQIKTVQQFDQELEDAIELESLGEAEEDADSITEAQDALRDLKARVQKMEIESLLSGEADANDAYLEVNAGAGGTEAQDWAHMLRRMYVRWAESQGYKVEQIAETEGEEAGIKSATLRISGHNAYGWLKSESGVHRLVRISPFDSQARRHTSFASVWVYPVIDDRIEIEILDKDVRVDTFRSSGAGGQHVNTTDSAVRLTHIPTGIVVGCQSGRSQHQNRAQAWDMLRARLYERELKRREEEAQATADQKSDIGWGNQLRSYVLQPYQMVKDVRTGVERTDSKKVLDGDITEFLEAALAQKVAPGQDDENAEAGA